MASPSDDFARMMLAQLMMGLDMPAAGTADRLNTALAFIAGVSPKNELETVLAVQMWMIHDTTVLMSSKIRSAQHLEQLNTYAGLMVKLARTYTSQMEGLA